MRKHKDWGNPIAALLANNFNMFNWFKKKTRSLERLRADKLEAYLNGSERVLLRTTALPGPGFGQEATGSEAKELGQYWQGTIRPAGACSGQGDIQFHVLVPTRDGFVQEIPTSHTPPPPASPAKQTSSRRTATPPSKSVSMAPGQTYRVPKRQIGSEILAGSSGTGTSGHSGFPNCCPNCEESFYLNIRTTGRSHP